MPTVELQGFIVTKTGHQYCVSNSMSHGIHQVRSCFMVPVQHHERHSIHFQISILPCMFLS